MSMTPPYPMPIDEEVRLAALRRLDILDSLPEAMFDDVVALAAQICGTPVGLVSLIDTDRQWFKARIGVDATQTPRDQAFCAHAIAQPQELLMVNDATQDPRFAANPLVLGEPNIRFYAGAPIVTSTGDALGTVCVIDTVPRELSDEQRAALRALARQTAALVELRKADLDKQVLMQELNRKVTAALAGEGGEHAALRQRQRVATIGELTSGLAHDFNNLLQTISASLQLIERKADSPDQVRRWASSAMGAISGGARLIAQLLAHTRNEEEGAGPIDVAAVVRGMSDMLTRALGPRIGLAVELETGHLQAMLVTGDAAQLESVLLNLAVNARDAMEGVGRLSISARRVQVAGDAELADGDYLALSVTDDGPGMPPDVARRAFEPFFTTKAQGKGTGLGLAQVQGFANRAGGVARIGPATPRGTVITLFLKLVGQG